METSLQGLKPALLPLVKRRVSRVGEVRKAAFRLGQFLLLLASIWLVLFAIYTALPYTRPGVNLIYNAKIADARSRQLFVANRPNRVLIFGNSQVLSGFIPDLFDKLSRGRAESFNMGLPDESWFVGALRDLLASGQRPTQVLLTLPWRADTNKKRTVFNLIPDDEKFLTAVFPFRKMPRDLALFAILSRSHGGLHSFYQYARDSVAHMRKDRGYYFIEGQSHYANNELPADFKLDEDSPNKPYVREVPDGGQEFALVRAWADEYRFDVYLVPAYLREHAAAAPAPRNQQTLKTIEPYARFHILGPDYFRYPNSLFSDHIHMNPHGAEVYTRAIFDLLAPHLKDDNSTAHH